MCLRRSLLKAYSKRFILYWPAPARDVPFLNQSPFLMFTLPFGTMITGYTFHNLFIFLNVLCQLSASGVYLSLKHKGVKNIHNQILFLKGHVPGVWGNTSPHGEMNGPLPHFFRPKLPLAPLE